MPKPIFNDLFGQQDAIAALEQAVRHKRDKLNHAWLFTGPPGSGRSNAAVAFAAALVRAGRPRRPGMASTAGGA